MIIKNSTTQTIKRSQINLNPLNPKRHSDKAILLQKKNLKKVGFLGGIVWNEGTGNLIDGHRRIQAMDSLYHYDGHQNDYDVKVESVQMNEQAEKEQLTYMAVGDTKPDIDLLARYIGDIDPLKYEELGFSDSQLNDLLSFNPDKPIIDEPLEDFLDDALKDFITPEERKQNVKEVKERVNQIAEDRERLENAFVTLSFGSYEAKCAFMDIMGVSPDERFVKGENVLSLIE